MKKKQTSVWLQVQRGRIIKTNKSRKYKSQRRLSLRCLSTGQKSVGAAPSHVTVCSSVVRQDSCSSFFFFSFFLNQIIQQWGSTNLAVNGSRSLQHFFYLVDSTQGSGLSWVSGWHDPLDPAAALPPLPTGLPSVVYSLSITIRMFWRRLDPGLTLHKPLKCNIACNSFYHL